MNEAQLDEFEKVTKELLKNTEDDDAAIILIDSSETTLSVLKGNAATLITLLYLGMESIPDFCKLCRKAVEYYEGQHVNASSEIK
jgi:hypothetical protein